MESEIRVRFVGSGDAFGSGGRLQACILLTGASETLMVDCGATSLVGIKRAGIEPNEIGFVAISHLHGDHFGGVPFLILDGQFDRRVRPLVIAGLPGVRERILAAMEILFPGSTVVRRRFDVDFLELEPRRPQLLGDASVEAFEAHHASGAPAYALRVGYGDRIIGYSGDTQWTERLVDVARDADLFICEAYFREKTVKFHLDYATLLSNRHRLNAKRIVVTHMSNDMLTLADGDMAVAFAVDGLVIEL